MTGADQHGFDRSRVTWRGRGSDNPRPRHARGRARHVNALALPCPPLDLSDSTRTRRRPGSLTWRRTSSPASGDAELATPGPRVAGSLGMDEAAGRAPRCSSARAASVQSCHPDLVRLIRQRDWTTSRRLGVARRLPTRRARRRRGADARSSSTGGASEAPGPVAIKGPGRRRSRSGRGAAPVGQVGDADTLDHPERAPPTARRDLSR